MGLVAWSLQTKPSEQISRRLAFEGFSGIRAHTIEVSGPDLGSKGSPNRTVRMEKIDNNWGLIDADHYSVKQKAVGELLSAIRKIKLSVPVTHRKVHHKKLQVSDESYERRIKVNYDHISKTKGSGTETVEKRTIDFYIGTKPHREQAHFRIAESETVYVVAGLDSWNIGVNLGDWTDKKYVEIEDEKLWEVKIENKKGRLHLVKHPEDGWNVQAWTGSELKTVDIAAMAKRASAIELHVPLGKKEKPGYGLEKPQAIVTLVTKTSTKTPAQIEKLQYWIGSQAPDELYYVKSENSEHHVKVRPIEVSSLIDASIESFR